MKEFFDEVDVGQNHASAAVSLELQFVKSVALAHILVQKLEVHGPFVPDHFSA